MIISNSKTLNLRTQSNQLDTELPVLYQNKEQLNDLVKKLIDQLSQMISNNQKQPNSETLRENQLSNLPLLQFSDEPLNHKQLWSKVVYENVLSQKVDLAKQYTESLQQDQSNQDNLQKQIKQKLIVKFQNIDKLEDNGLSLRQYMTKQAIKFTKINKFKKIKEESHSFDLDLLKSKNTYSSSLAQEQLNSENGSRSTQSKKNIKNYINKKEMQKGIRRKSCYGIIFGKNSEKMNKFQHTICPLYKQNFQQNVNQQALTLSQTNKNISFRKLAKGQQSQRWNLKQQQQDRLGNTSPQNNLAQSSEKPENDITEFKMSLVRCDYEQSHEQSIQYPPVNESSPLHAQKNSYNLLFRAAIVSFDSEITQIEITKSQQDIDYKKQYNSENKDKLSQQQFIQIFDKQKKINKIKEFQKLQTQSQITLSQQALSPNLNSLQSYFFNIQSLKPYGLNLFKNLQESAISSISKYTLPNLNEKYIYNSENIQSPKAKRNNQIKNIYFQSQKHNSSNKLSSSSKLQKVTEQYKNNQKFSKIDFYPLTQKGQQLFTKKPAHQRSHTILSLATLYKEQKIPFQFQKEKS